MSKYAGIFLDPNYKHIAQKSPKNNRARLTKPIEGIEHMTTEEIFGATIKQLRERQRLSIRNLAFDTDLSETTISRMERGDGTTLRNAEKVAHALGCELYELL